MAALIVGVIVGAITTVGVVFSYKTWRNSSEQTAIQLETHLDSHPCQLNPIVRIISVDESPIAGVRLQLEIGNDGRGRAFNVEYEARSTFLWDFDQQWTVRCGQTSNLTRRDPRVARSQGSYPTFGFNELWDIPPFIRDVGIKYLEPNQHHSVKELFFVPWKYLGHPSERELKPLEETFFPGISEEDLKTLEETVVPGVPKDEVKTIFEKFKSRQSPFEELNFSPTTYKMDEKLPPGLVLYGTQDYGYRKPGKSFLFGPGNGLQLTLRFSHCGGDETKYFALPRHLPIFHPKPGTEISLVETDVNGVDLVDSKQITVY